MTETRINIFMLISGATAVICASSACCYRDESGHHVPCGGTVSQNIHSETWKCQVIREENKYQQHTCPILEERIKACWHEFKHKTCWSCPCFSYQSSWNKLWYFFLILNHAICIWHSTQRVIQWIDLNNWLMQFLEVSINSIKHVYSFCSLEKYWNRYFAFQHVT